MHRQPVLLTALTVLGLLAMLFVTATPARTSALVPPIDAGRPAAQVTGLGLNLEPSRHAVEPVATAAAPTAPPQETLQPQPQLVALAHLTVDVWHAAERYFSVSGDSPARIVASALANVPHDASGAERHAMAYAGPTVWEHRPSYVMDAATGSCTMTGVESTVAYQATVPQWTSPSIVSPGLLAWWKVVLEHIRQHEGQHIRIFTDFVSALPARVANQPCGSWNAIVTTWSADIVSAQAAFDAAEARWAYPVYAGS